MVIILWDTLYVQKDVRNINRINVGAKPVSQTFKPPHREQLFVVLFKLYNITDTDVIQWDLNTKV
jgi:hypothetical protein